MSLNLCPCLCRCILLFAWHSRELQKHLHGNKCRHGACVLHRCRQHVAEVGVEVLLIVGGQAQSLEPPPCSVVLNLLHQSSPVTFPSLLLGHNHRLDEQAAAVTYDPGQPCMAQQPLRLFVAQQEDQADGELWTGLLEGVNPGGLASLPL